MKNKLEISGKCLSFITKIINFITARALHNQSFTKLLDEVEAQYSGLVMHNRVRCLRRGQVFNRFVELLEEVGLFKTEKEQANTELTELNRLRDLMIFAYFTALYSALNKK